MTESSASHFFHSSSSAFIEAALKRSKKFFESVKMCGKEKSSNPCDYTWLITLFATLTWSYIDSFLHFLNLSVLRFTIWIAFFAENIKKSCWSYAKIMKTGKSIFMLWKKSELLILSMRSWKIIRIFVRLRGEKPVVHGNFLKTKFL